MNARFSAVRTSWALTLTLALMLIGSAGSGCFGGKAPPRTAASVGASSSNARSTRPGAAATEPTQPVPAPRPAPASTASTASTGDSDVFDTLMTLVEEPLSLFDEPPPPPPAVVDVSVAEEPAAAAELEALRNDLAFPRSLVIPLLLLLAWAMSRAIGAATRFVRRLGLKRRRMITSIGALLSISVWIAVLVAIINRLLFVAPTLTLGVLTISSITAIVLLRRQLENLASGIGLAIRNQLREGDRIELGEYDGVVRRVGFTRVELHQADGSRLYLPNRLVTTEAVTVGPARYSVPLQLSLGRDRPWTAEEIEDARRLARLSPYRDPSGRVVVEAHSDGEHRLLVQLQVWSPRLVAAAEQHLRRQLDRNVAHPRSEAAHGRRPPHTAERGQSARRAFERQDR